MKFRIHSTLNTYFCSKERHSYLALGACALAAVSLFSCTADQNEVIGQQGYIAPNVSIDATMTYLGTGATTEISPEFIPEVGDMEFRLSTADKQYGHTWYKYSEYNADQSLKTGRYNLNFTTPAELIRNGYVNFAADAEVTLNAGENVLVPITLKPVVGRIDCQSSKTFDNDIELSALLVNDSEGKYQYVENEDGKIDGEVYVSPGDIGIIAKLKSSSGAEVRIMCDPEIKIDVQQIATASASLDAGVLKLDFGSQQSSIAVSSEIFDMQSPRLSAIGFNPDETFKAVEGVPLDQALKVEAKASRPLKHIFLNIDSPLYGENNLAEYDLIQGKGDIEALKASGVVLSNNQSKHTFEIDFTKAIENVATQTSALTRISVLAVDDRGLCSEPLAFEINTATVNFKLISLSAARIGIEESTITMLTSTPLLETSDFRIMAHDSSSGNKVECKINDLHMSEKNTQVSIDFTIPRGVNPVNIDVEYMGVNRLSATVQRSNPQFDMTFDTYATTTYVHINADSREVASAIVSLASFMANGERATIWERYPEEGIIVLSGLRPSTKYLIEVKFGQNPIASSGSIVTEAASQLPDGDFEDAKEIIDYKHMASGGRYSTTDLQLVSRQNFVDVSVFWPKKYWASVNAKTFNKSAKNHNTWYMQPSSEIAFDAISGTKSIKISSVGWDLNGEAIPDYIQAPGEHLQYNNNVPKVRHRSAGRLFLGSYTFNATTETETFNEGVSFSSRPSSLNGFYKYHPDPDHPMDRGIAKIEIYGKNGMGKEILIASGNGVFRFTPDFTAFNIPITYELRNVKATRLCVMFGSTVEIGDAEFEDKHVPLTPIPEKAKMVGSTLWIDNLSLSY